MESLSPVYENILSKHDWQLTRHPSFDECFENIKCRCLCRAQDTTGDIKNFDCFIIAVIITWSIITTSSFEPLGTNTLTQNLTESLWDTVPVGLSLSSLLQEQPPKAMQSRETSDRVLQHQRHRGHQHVRPDAAADVTHTGTCSKFIPIAGRSGGADSSMCPRYREDWLFWVQISYFSSV